ncbi:potassium-transporting ATPase subunit KdpA [Streptomyces sp. NPDC002523]
MGVEVLREWAARGPGRSAPARTSVGTTLPGRLRTVDYVGGNACLHRSSREAPSGAGPIPRPDAEQDWRHYLFALLAFTVAGIGALFALLTLQGKLPWSTGHAGMPWRLALHTAVSFTTNTSWQNYAGESTTGHLAVMAGLGVQAFASAAVGICAALALVRGLARRDTDRLGNFWVDLIRTIFRVMLSLPMVFLPALAGRLARQQPGVVTVGTPQARGVNFVALATGAALILALLNFLPALSLGPPAEGLQ